MLAKVLITRLPESRIHKSIPAEARVGNLVLMRRLSNFLLLGRGNYCYASRFSSGDFLSARVGEGGWEIVTSRAAHSARTQFFEGVGRGTGGWKMGSLRLQFPGWRPECSTELVGGRK